MIGDSFICNVCGSQSRFDPKGNDWREAPSCDHCGSSVRVRHVAYCLTAGVLGSPKSLSEVRRPDLVGVGLSDPDGLAASLAAAFSYTNSYYHAEPLLDICHPSARWENFADFLISSDVFEHVPIPVSSAFSGAFRVLRPGGHFVLTVPFDSRATTTEHYPNIVSFKTEQFENEWILIGKTATGRFEIHQNPVFHGGPGTTVELRFFALSDVIRHLERAGFEGIQVHDTSVPEFGIFLAHNQGLPITAQKPKTS